MGRAALSQVSMPAADVFTIAFLFSVHEPVYPSEIVVLLCLSVSIRKRNVHLEKKLVSCGRV